jgi:hypothetical protein
LWIIVITVFFCLPTATPITRETLNYTPVVQCFFFFLLPFYMSKYWMFFPSSATGCT